MPRERVGLEFGREGELVVLESKVRSYLVCNRWDEANEANRPVGYYQIWLCEILCQSCPWDKYNRRLELASWSHCTYPRSS